jgi:hypothetical protein
MTPPPFESVRASPETPASCGFDGAAGGYGRMLRRRPGKTSNWGLTLYRGTFSGTFSTRSASGKALMVSTDFRKPSMVVGWVGGGKGNRYPSIVDVICSQ